jgi:hypothetical protein
LTHSLRRCALLALLTLAATACAARHPTEPEPSPAMQAFAGADSLHVASLAPGVLHARVWDRTGPWAIHVLEVDTARCRPRWAARKPAGTLDARATTSALAGDALAAINADFFQLPGAAPVGPHVSDGRQWPRAAPGLRERWRPARIRCPWCS